MEQLLVREEAAVARPTPLLDLKEPWQGKVGKATEAEFLLISLGFAVTRELKWKAKRDMDWEDPADWKYLTVCCSPSVEQLRERFVGMEV